MHIGHSTPRKEGRSKVTGQAGYVDDRALPGMLHGVTVRSHCSRGVIRDIRFDASIPWDEFTIVTAADIPGANVVARMTDDQPYLSDGRVNHAEEPVVLLAHPDRSLLEEARRQVTIEIEPLPPVYTIDDSLAADTVIWGQDTTPADAAAALAQDISPIDDTRSTAQYRLQVARNLLIQFVTALLSRRTH
jgi:CO/xanthine dehydrogenase Mo-binding subunit